MQKGKTALSVIGILCLVLSLIFVVVGVILTVGAFVSAEINIIKLVFGILMILLFIPLLILGITQTWLALSLNATKGTVVEDNLGKLQKNKELCKICGNELDANGECERCKSHNV